METSLFEVQKSQTEGQEMQEIETAAMQIIVFCTDAALQA
jgi:hypothetical protein